MIIGVLFVVLLAALAIWQIVSRWRTSMRLELHGRLIQAHVTDIKKKHISSLKLVGQPVHTKNYNTRIFFTLTGKIHTLNTSTLLESKFQISINSLSERRSL